jgi:uncharacterized protein YecE (DUF72 family)
MGETAPALGTCLVRAGTSSWADRSLVREGRFYPRKTMSARERLGYYCDHFALAEIATTYRFPPTPEVARQWAERTPEGFTFDVRAWSLLTGNPTFPDSLYEDLQPLVRPSRRDGRRLYAGHLPAEPLDECWRRFAHALDPLRRAGRLGVVTLRYPSWFSPRPEAWAELARVRDRLPGLACAVELTSPRWFAGDACDDTLEFLEQHGLGFVCVDGPTAEGQGTGGRGGPPVVAATTETAVVRFRGRRVVEGEPWAWPYRYSAGELAAWVRPVGDLASAAREVHLIFDNCWRSDAVDNAAALSGLIAAAS